MRLSNLIFLGLMMVIGTTTIQAKSDLKIYGSNTVGAELAPALVKAWLQKEGYTEISARQMGSEHIVVGTNHAGKQRTVELDTKGSTTGFVALKDQQADVAMSSRHIKSSEIAALKRFGRCDTAACEYVIALDGIAVIVNPQNPLLKIKKSALQGLFSGKFTDWAEVGGTPGPVHIHALDENSGTYDTFKTLVLGKGTKLATSAKRDASHETISAMVAKDPSAIGFVGLPFVNNSKPLAVADGEAHYILPNAFSVATEDYVLARRLFFYLPEISATPLAKSFVEFTVANAGQEQAEKIGFVSQEVIGGEVEADSNAPDEYSKLISGAKRLSLNFRFLPGGLKLDNKGARDVARLKSYMKQQAGKKLELMLFGFADSNESMPIVSHQLSVDRADTVADLLIKEGLRPGKVRGYGNAVPVASNEAESGRAKNRRVEVWVR